LEAVSPPGNMITSSSTRNDGIERNRRPSSSGSVSSSQGSIHEQMTPVVESSSPAGTSPFLALPTGNLVSSSYAYPFSALSVRSLAAVTSPSGVVPTPSAPPPLASSTSNSPRTVVSRENTRLAPIMTAQYEDLSDED
jgi:hypothetical protein